MRSVYSHLKICDTNCVAVLFNLIKNRKALFKIVKFWNVSDVAKFEMFRKFTILNKVLLFLII